ncbi:aldose 1-epimerase [Kushneria sinocarnis]|uniref:Aldose 1-epimerase n=1 Tax=Kushneria sinocarnis TaxID=595502 RepID=A0A420WZM0_9GAMM|nr:aldose epimerase family protein [Kushneria sinocarnis]RKR06781.1 aldose 1-epimerase [Kushneria sinocarnis]
MYRSLICLSLTGLLAVASGAIAAEPTSSNQGSSMQKGTPGSSDIRITEFGKLPDGTAIKRYQLSNANGMEVAILTYGGIVQSIRVPDRNGNFDDIALGYATLQGYLDDQRNDHTYFGALIGRYANRLAGGRFSLDGSQYQVPANNGPNSLHGGPEGLDTHVWKAHTIEGNGWQGVELSTLSPDGEMGFPGDLAVTVRYTLNNDNELRIHYTAISNALTVINLTNHTYFNLSGAGNGTVLDQVAMLNASHYTPMNEQLIPTGEIATVADTPMDFRRPTAIGEHIHADHQQLKYAEPEQGGYDLNWILDNPGKPRALDARVIDPESGRQVEMYTTEPGVQFYTGNFINGIQGKQGKTYQHWGGFTLEAQHFPDSPNQPEFPSTRLAPGEPYSQTTIYKFLPL